MKKITALILFVLASLPVFSQTDKQAGNSNSEIISSPVPNPLVSEIIKNIKTARVSSDIASQRYWEAQLHELTKPQIINSSPFNSKPGKIESGNSNNLEALNITRITDAIIVANSISRERVSGYIFAAIGVWGGVVNTDTLKVYRSTNDGLSFTQILNFAEGMKIAYNGLDVEAVSKGDSSYAFVCMDFTTSGGTVKSSAIVRVRQDGNMFNVRGLFGGIGTNSYINGRITSDNARYTTNAYVYYTLTLDSIVSGTRRLKSKLYRIEQPFSSEMPLIAGFEDAIAGQYAYYVAGAAPDSAKFESDIAFVNTSADVDQLYTVTIVRGVTGLFGNGANLYFSKSTDYGTTTPALFFTADSPYLKESPRMAATGFSNNSAVVLTRRLFGGGDWDPYYFYSADITTGAPVFSNNYLSSTTDTTMGVSVAARQRSNSSYLFAFSNRLGPNESKIYTRTFNTGSFGALTQANPNNLTGTNIYGYPDAGFRNVNNDSCLVIWGGFAGNGSYVTGGCGGTFTNVGSTSSIAESYGLSQNYPNPFNPTTIINYSLPVQSNVSVKIFDVLGKEIGNLVNELQTAGNHSVEFNGVNLPSGVYYYRLEANGFTDTKKMILVK